MKRLCLVLAALAATAAAQNLSLERITSYPFPNELAAAPTGSRLAWAVNQSGVRNIYVAEGPSFTPRKLTNYPDDDGQELTSVSLSKDGKYVVYVRGGDHGGNHDRGATVNPTFSTTPPKLQVWSVGFSAGSEPKLLGEGDDPEISPDGSTVAFLKGGQAFAAAIDGSSKAPRALFTTRGSVSELQWSPTGAALSFTANRGDHSFIGVYREGGPIVWLAPGFHRDRSPRWSPDSTRIAFVRTAGEGGAPAPMLVPKLRPWSIWTASALDGSGAKQIRNSPATPRGSLPGSEGGTNLHWAAQGRIVFLSYEDGWPHLYSIPENGGQATLLTPGPFMAESIRLSPDGRTLLFQGNTGPDKLDADRRHVVRVAVDRPGIEVFTPGEGIEAEPILTGDGTTVAFLSATPSRPAVLAVKPSAGGPVQVTGAGLAAGVPWNQLITPRQVIFQASDGVTVHGQLFEKSGGDSSRKPALLYIHGGPQRQMLLGWSYMDYYANAYAVNQYLASRGFVVLSVNYRLGIGYGYDFHYPPASGAAGASEYLDVKAAGEWLARQPQVDPARIGVFGGSYGGYLTAMALAKDSKLFAAGADVHGVHDWSVGMSQPTDRFERIPDFDQAVATAFKSSPVAWVSGWKSPVLFIHGDDDRNVNFNQSINLIQRLEPAGVPLETMVVVDDTHHFMRHANQLRVDEAIAEFLERKLQPQSAGSR